MSPGKEVRWPHVAGFSPATAKLVGVLEHGVPGDTISDERSAGICGLDCKDTRGRGRASIRSAIRHVERVHGVVWRREPGLGLIKCLNASERIELAHSQRQHISRTARRASRVVSTVSLDDIDEKDRPSARALGAQLATLLMFSGSDTHKKLVAHKASIQPQLATLLEAFK